MSGVPGRSCNRHGKTNSLILTGLFLVVSQSICLPFAQAQQAAVAVPSDFSQKYKPPIVIAVDGVSVPATLLPGVERKGPYLGPALQQSDNIRKMRAEIKMFAWSGDLRQTPSAVADLKKIILQAIEVARNEDRFLAIVAHSWGGILSYLALRDLEQNQQIKVADVGLLITIHTPLGVDEPSPYLAGPLFRAVGAMKATVTKYVGQTNSMYVGVADQIHLVTPDRWLNYYSQKDPFSAALVAALNEETDRDHITSYTELWVVNVYASDIAKAVMDRGRPLRFHLRTSKGETLTLRVGEYYYGEAPHRWPDMAYWWRSRHEGEERCQRRIFVYIDPTERCCPELLDFMDDTIVSEIFSSVLAYIGRECPSLMVEDLVYPVEMVMGLPNGGIYAKIIKEEKKWKLEEYRNSFAEAYRQEKAREAEEQAREAEARARLQEQEARLREEAARREAEKEAQKALAQRTLDELKRRYGATRVTSCAELDTNPFSFEREVVLLAVSFEAMLERDKALFDATQFPRVCGLVVSGIPPGTFSTARSYVLLAGRVRGRTQVQLPLGPRPLPHLTYVGVYFCKRKECAELFSE